MITENTVLPNTGFIRLKDLLKIIPVSKSTLYSWIKDKKFPKPIKLVGGRASAFCVNDVQNFIKNHQEASTPIDNKKGGTDRASL